VTDTRRCEQCGTQFEPRREHARFCSARCRVAWNREQSAGQPPEGSALTWSITAMTEATDRLRRVGGARPQAYAAISEAVWWVTIVDGTLVRYYPEAYDRALEELGPAERRLTERTFGGLRYVRNRVGYYADPDDFIQPRVTRSGADDGRVASWQWKHVAEPALASLPPRGRAWEMTRYEAYQAELAGHPIGETFGRAAGFLRLACARAATGPPGPDPQAAAGAAASGAAPADAKRAVGGAAGPPRRASATA
jgi:hypothetical protein